MAVDSLIDYLRGRKGLFHAQTQVAKLLVAGLTLTAKDLNSVFKQPGRKSLV